MQITNSTPWNTEGLTALVTAMGDTIGRLEKISFVNHQPQPGVKREKQEIYKGSEPYHYGNRPNEDEAYITELVFEILTPKRVKSRTSTLDRLAFVKDLESYEVPLPDPVIAGIVHALHTATKRHDGEDRWDRQKHLRATCECNKTLPEAPIIPGDTRVKTRPPVTLAQLERKLYYADALVGRCQKELAESIVQADKLRVRIEKKKIRDAKEQAKLDRIAAKAKLFDDRTLSAVAGERPTP